MGLHFVQDNGEGITHSAHLIVSESDCLSMATNPTVDANLASADDLLARLLEHVEANQSADLQLVALTAQALATVALVHVVTELAQALIDCEA